MSNTPSPSIVNAQAEWFLTPAGRYVAQWSLETADSLLLDVFGLQAAQIGCETLDFLAHNRIQHRFRCAALQQLRRRCRRRGAVQRVRAALPQAASSISRSVVVSFANRRNG